MKKATIPSLRVSEEFREAAESVLREGETLSAFVEDALRRQIESRRTQKEFIARGLASRDEARLTGLYFSADDVHDELNAMLAAKKAVARS